jgi:hypothetical protein
MSRALGLYPHNHFPQLGESFSAMYIRNVSRQSEHANQAKQAVCSVGWRMVDAENGSRWRMAGAGPRASVVMNFRFSGARGTSVPVDDLVFLFSFLSRSIVARAASPQLSLCFENLCLGEVHNPLP